MLTFEEVDAHVDSLEVSSGANIVGATAPGTISLEQITTIYKQVRPILILVQGMPFFPAKWRGYYTTFLNCLDVFTGVTVP